ncbi:S-adenosylmethionine decarboxylase proenzyme [Emticicia aquatica]|uniref:S-adenosylmethionine decarboxylase proenzyme n=1 Tax=Emticicia aquatica TaxID=1681835 RepID=A0ABM9ALJ8_9BACT|nr:S-adenosylmethionine decarboxylase [Emticicia aquatica]CAH0994613.1 S-adenosylmethionine decarboxylase proenzyme [Emticicia aquatica]
MTYSKGLHILAEIETNSIEVLKNFAETQNLLQKLIEKHRLTIVGEVFANFDGGGFTGVYCLTESHISIHTWPEFGRVTYDVFLSNFRNNNEFIVRDIHQELIAFFNPIEVNLNEIYR